MKRLVNLFLSLCCCVAVFSQNLRDFSVISFKEDIYSSTATNRRYKLVDGNGETFSIIKLNAVTPDDDLSAYSLDFGCYEGRKKIVDGEVWWYVQCNAKHATISREGYKTLKYELDETVEPGTVYYMTFEVIDRTVRAANSYGAAAPGIPVKDTVKTVVGGIVENTPDRSRLKAIQTPQVFDVDLLRVALAKADQELQPITDDCSAVELLGMSVRIVEGDERNIKVTTPLDLKLAEMILEEMQ
jgi:hypothetical protein